MIERANRPLNWQKLVGDSSIEVQVCQAERMLTTFQLALLVDPHVAQFGPTGGTVQLKLSTVLAMLTLQIA